MDKKYYKIIKYMIDNPNSKIDDIQSSVKIDKDLFDKILDYLYKNGYIKVFLGRNFEVNITGYEFQKSYYPNKIKTIFKDYIFQIILSLLSFGLGLLSGLILK